jgi:glycosyltransferase involved in cell wall biosynthesis
VAEDENLAFPARFHARLPQAPPPRTTTPGLNVLQIGKFYPPYRGGIENHLEVLCRELHKSIAVQVVVANDGHRTVESEVDGISVKRLARIFSLSAAPVCPRLIHEIRTSNADLVHLHLPNPPAMLACLASGGSRPLVVTWHSDIIRQRMLSPLLRPFERMLASRSSALIATSPTYAETSPLLSRYRDRCHIIPHGISIEIFKRRDEERIANFRRRFGDRIIITVGRLVYYKGFEHLIRAMADVRGHLIVVGEGPLRVPLESEAVAAGAGDRVTFLGHLSQDDVIACYHAAEVFALPSIARSEAFGIVQLEAMACGKAVVNTRLESGVPYVSLDGVTGITVPPRQSAPLAQALNHLLDDPLLRARYGAAASRRVREEFSSEMMARRTLALYHDVCGVHRAPAAARC